MARTANVLPQRGTRFVIFLQEPHVLAGATETVWVDTPPDEIALGPADRDVHVVDAIDKESYQIEPSSEVRYRTLPPYKRETGPKPRPDGHGHYDHLKPGMTGFDAAHLFAVVKCVHAIWAHHFGRALPWFFGVDALAHVPRGTGDFHYLEVIPHVESMTSWSGPGYVEFGYPKFLRKIDHDRSDPYCENFDAIGHEMGHVVLKNVIANLPEKMKTLEHRAHEEAGADLVAAVASLNFDGEVDRVLAETRGRLFSVNALSRMAAYSVRAGDEARVLFNDATLASLEQAKKDGDKHAYSVAFSGAAYDVFCGIYADHLMDRGVVPNQRAALAAGPRTVLATIESQIPLPPPAAARDAMLDARDEFGRLLARAWDSLHGQLVSYASAAAAILAADAGGHHRDVIRWAFANRGLATP
jgi:hypothetical protein